MLYSKQQTIMSAAAVIALMYGFSAVLGFIKNRLLAHYFGASSELGVFFAADLVPNFIFTLLVSGAMSAAFIPVFKKYYHHDKMYSWKMTSGVLNIMLFAFLIISSVVFFAAEPIAGKIVAHQGNLSASDVSLMARLTRVMIFAQFIFIISSVLTGLLESFNRFIISAFAPVMYNLGIIICLVLLVKPFGIFAPSIGMVVGAFLHMGIQIPFVKQLGFRYIFSLNFRNKGVREIFKLAVPRTIGQAAPQILRLVYTNLALFISAPSMVVWKFAGDLQILPVRLFGISIGRAALPIFSDAYKENGDEALKLLLIKTIHQVMFFILPLSVLLFILRIPLVRLAYGARAFPWEATVMTAYTLAFFSISIAIQAIVNILVKTFYALRDTKTPLWASAVTVLANTVLAVYFIRGLGLGVWSLALAFTMGSVINCLVLFYFLSGKIGAINFVNFIRPINKIGVASFLTGVALYLPLKVMDQIIFDTTRTVGLIMLTTIVSLIGFLTYIILAWVFKVDELKLVLATASRIKKSLGLPARYL